MWSRDCYKEYISTTLHGARLTPICCTHHTWSDGDLLRGGLASARHKCMSCEVMIDEYCMSGAGRGGRVTTAGAEPGQARPGAEAGAGVHVSCGWGLAGVSIQWCCETILEKKVLMIICKIKVRLYPPSSKPFYLAQCGVLSLCCSVCHRVNSVSSWNCYIVSWVMLTYSSLTWTTFFWGESAPSDNLLPCSNTSSRTWEVTAEAVYPWWSTCVWKDNMQEGRQSIWYVWDRYKYSWLWCLNNKLRHHTWYYRDTDLTGVMAGGR